MIELGDAGPGYTPQPMKPPTLNDWVYDGTLIHGKIYFDYMETEDESRPYPDGKLIAVAPKEIITSGAIRDKDGYAYLLGAPHKTQIGKLRL